MSAKCAREYYSFGLLLRWLTYDGKSVFCQRLATAHPLKYDVLSYNLLIYLLITYNKKENKRKKPWKLGGVKVFGLSQIQFIF